MTVRLEAITLCYDCFHCNQHSVKYIIQFFNILFSPCRNDTGVFVSDVVKGGVAEADGRLLPGDQILSVNGEDLKNATQEIAAGVLKVTMVTSLGKYQGDGFFFSCWW